MTDAHGSLPRFSITDDEEGSELAKFTGLRGFFVGHRSAYADFEEWDFESINEITFEVIGLIPNSPIASIAERAPAGKCRIGNIGIRILGSRGDVMGEYFVSSAEMTGFSAIGGDVSRVVVSGSVDKIPEAGAAGVWDIWRQGPPDVKNAWAQLRIGQREGWLEVVRMYHPAVSDRRSTDPAVNVFVLDGRYVEDLASFYLAVGEAIKGPGGYFGSTLMGLEDCLRGCFGASVPFTLVWESFEIAQRNLSGRLVETVSGRKSYLDIIMEVFSDMGVEVVRSP